MPEKTNNSLSDLNGSSELRFTDYVNKDPNSLIEKEEKFLSDQNKFLDDKIEGLKKRRNNSKDNDELEKIDAEIANLQRRKENNKKNVENNQNRDNLNNKSFFVRYGYVDYARIPNAKQDWKHFKTREEGDISSGFITNTSYQRRENTPVPGDSELDSKEGLSITHLVNWSEKYPAIQLRPQDFAYAKRLGVYPNNRLVVLRRFKNGVPDNLFDYHIQSGVNQIEYLQPISTLVTWIRPDEDFINLNFNERWEQWEKGIIETIKGELGGAITGDTTASEGIGSNIFNNSLLSAFLDQLSEIDGGLKREDGVPFFSRNLDGNPNIIKESSKRKTGGGGIESTISFDLTFEYEMRYINGIDPGIAMLDLIANCIRMGTSVSEFRFPIPALKNSNFVKNAINGNFSGNFKQFFSKIKDFVTKTYKTLKNTISEGIDTIKDVNSGDNTESDNDNIQGILQFIISRYREELKAALASETGSPSGIWHVTIGNPKNPIISCGDLIIKSSNIKLGKELGFNDFPNEFSVTYNLESARSRGRDEITRIFNSGRSRVYVYPKYFFNPDYDSLNNASISNEKFLNQSQNNNS